VTRLAVVGLGLIGGSAASAARRAGMTVIGYDAELGHGKAALERGLVDELAGSIEEAAQCADIVLLAAPVLAIASSLPEVDITAPPGALILDAGSAKLAIVNTMASLPGAERMVGGHPLAGSERSGPEAADSHLFEGRVWVLTGNAHTSEHSMERAVGFVSLLGARSVCVDAETHDRALAHTSHLPQLIATALVLAGRDQPVQLTGPAYAAMTRIAGSDPNLWREILESNREEIVPALAAFSTVIDSMLVDLSAGNVDALVERIEEGRSSMRIGSLPV